MLCECGCGQEAGISVWRTKPRRFMNGHQSRKPHKERYLFFNRWYVWKPGHHRATSRGFVLEHVVIAEVALGHLLSPMTRVHHFDEDPSNNVHNLIICQDEAYHALLHIRRRAFLICGDPNWRKCHYCKRYDSPEKMISQKGTVSMIHRECRRSYLKNRRMRQCA